MGAVSPQGFVPGNLSDLYTVEGSFPMPSSPLPTADIAATEPEPRPDMTIEPDGTAMPNSGR